MSDTPRATEKRRHTPPTEIEPPRTVAGRKPPIYNAFYINITNNMSEERRALAFMARSVEVNNYSGFWLYFRSLDIFVPPRIVGLIVNKPAGFNILTLVPEVPTGVHNNRDTTTSLCIVTVIDRPQVPSAGFLIRDIPDITAPIEGSEGTLVNPATDTLLATTGALTTQIDLVGNILLYEESGGAATTFVIIEHRNAADDGNIASVTIALFPSETLVIPYTARFAASERLRIIMGSIAVGVNIDVEALIIMGERGPLYAV